MTLDIEKYMPFMEGLDLTKAQKEELIQTLWTFTESMVDKAFGKHPVQLARGYVNESNLRNGKQMIESSPSPVLTEFDDAANDNTYAKEKKRYG